MSCCINVSCTEGADWMRKTVIPQIIDTAKAVIQKIKEIVSKLFPIIATLLLLQILPGYVFAGFFVSLFFPNQVRQGLDRLAEIWNQQKKPTPGEAEPPKDPNLFWNQLKVRVPLAIVGVLYLPYTASLLAFCAGAKVGMRDSNEKKTPETPTPQSPAAVAIQAKDEKS